jgi:predicted site-specific integrase-resolvase
VPGTGLSVVQVEAEAGSEMDWSRAKVRRSRAKVRRLLLGPAATVVMAGHRDRLGRVNTELAAAALSARTRRLGLPGDSEVTGDLAGGTAEVVAWFYAGLCGSRPTRDRALKALGCVQQDIGPRAVKLQTSGGGV